jgi:transposase-like protein
MGTWRRHSREFKQQAVERMKGCENIHALARELGVERKLLYSWKYQFEGRPEKNHANYGKAGEETTEARLRRENRELKESLGSKTAELDFFAAALRRVEQEQKKLALGGTGSTPRSMPRLSRKGA